MAIVFQNQLLNHIKNLLLIKAKHPLLFNHYFAKSKAGH